MTHYEGGNEERRLEQRLRILVASQDNADAREDERRLIAEGVGYERITHADGTFSVRRIDAGTTGAPVVCYPRGGR